MERERKDHLSGAGRTEGFSGIFPYIVSPVGGARGDFGGAAAQDGFPTDWLRRPRADASGEHGEFYYLSWEQKTADCGDRAG